VARPSGQEQEGRVRMRSIAHATGVSGGGAPELGVLVGPLVALLAAALCLRPQPHALNEGHAWECAAAWCAPLVLAAAALFVFSKLISAVAGTKDGTASSPEIIFDRSAMRGEFVAPLEAGALRPEQLDLLNEIREVVRGKTWRQLRRNANACHWLQPPGSGTDGGAEEVVSFSERDLVRVVRSIEAGGTNGMRSVDYGAVMLEQAYAYRHDHGMDRRQMLLDLTPDDIRKCRQVHPKAACGLAGPHGYPIMWDLVSTLRVPVLEDLFGNLDRGLQKLLWYDLYIMESYERFKMQLSKNRGQLLLKGVQVFDFSAFRPEVLHPAIIRVVLQIIARSGQLWAESVWRVYLVSVPRYFMPFWSVIKRAAHPVTVAKVHMFSDRDSFMSHLKTDLGILPEEVPSECGGKGPSLQQIPIVPGGGGGFDTCSLEF